SLRAPAESRTLIRQGSRAEVRGRNLWARGSGRASIGGMATALPVASPASTDDLAVVDAWWRAANYLSVGQIYLLDNPLLREPLRLEHVKPRLLGHWGTAPGLNLVYAHLNRVIRARDLNAVY